MGRDYVRLRSHRNTDARNQRWGRTQSLRNGDKKTETGGEMQGAPLWGKLGGSGKDRESRAVREGGLGLRGEERKRVMLDRREEVMGRRR